GVALGIVQDDKIVFAGGFGVREAGRQAKVDPDTLFLSASVTKPLTTLMLAKLVDAGRFNWDTPVIDVLPTFKLGDAEMTRQVQIKHLVCACTGLPRRDIDWTFASKGATPASVVKTLATMKPNSKLGELYQYSNLLAATGGFVGGHALYPSKELGAAYDAAMQTLVFNPLGMTRTTFDFAVAQRGNYAAPHDRDIDGRTVRASMGFNYTGIPMRPDGGAWSSLADLLRYVRMELDDGLLVDGQRYIERSTLLARRQQQVARGGENQGYGMGLKIDSNKGTQLVWHGGSMAGYQAEVAWLPEHRVGVVFLANANAGVYMRGPLQQRLMEVLFDAEPRAVKSITAQAKRMVDNAQSERKKLTWPPSPLVTRSLATHYRNPELGSIEVIRKGAATWLDFGVWKSEVATRTEIDGTNMLVTISPGVSGFQFVVNNKPGQRSLLLPEDHIFGEVLRGAKVRTRPLQTVSTAP
ncbi:MAG: serine hydrolase domain-containing protein, partial [Telluria sp.]